MTLYAPSIAVDAAIDALVVLVAQICPGARVIRGQVNRVPMPPDPCVVLTELFQDALGTPHAEYPNTTAPTTADLVGPTKVDVQADFYGPMSGEQCNGVAVALRTVWGVAQFPATVQPLYCSNCIQSPLISGEQQWVSRWTLTISLQYNPVITVPQDYANTLAPTVKLPADLTSEAIA